MFWEFLQKLILLILSLLGIGGGTTNQAPTQTSAIIATAEDTTSVPVTPSVTDPNAGDTHTFTIVTPPTNGAASIVANQLVYTPNANFNGADNFSFRATDQGGLSVVGTAAVTVSPVNDAPVITGAPATSVAVGAPYFFMPTTVDVDGDTPTYMISNMPAWASFDPITGAVTGTPAGYHIGTTKNVTISVTDGIETVSLPSFDISVTAIARCTDDSVFPADNTTIIRSAPCGRYGVVTTRRDFVNGVDGDVTVRYMVHSPVSDPKGIVVLLAGGNGGTGIAGNAATGEVTANGNNFLVRSAQLFAERGYRTITIDRPSNSVNFDSLQYDQYRVSSRHAQDLATVIAQENAENLDVYLVGTSRGAMSAVAQSRIAAGIAISSAVTSGGPFYLGIPTVARLQPESVGVPVHMKIHVNDGCAVSNPANAPSIFSRFTGAGAWYVNAGATNRFDSLVGGFDLTGIVSEGTLIQACDAKTFHGYLGIENAAVQDTTAWLDGLRALMQTVYAGNHKPVASSTILATTPDTPINVDLTTLTTDADNDILSYRLAFGTSSRGGTVSLAGSILTYTPPVGAIGIRDGFVYTTFDQKGGVAMGVIAVEISN